MSYTLDVFKIRIVGVIIIILNAYSEYLCQISLETT